MKVLVLGHTGMLGNCVDKYLSSFKNIETFNVSGRWPNDDFLTDIVNIDVDYVGWFLDETIEILDELAQSRAIVILR